MKEEKTNPTVYLVMCVEEGSYIGHGLYNESSYVDSVHSKQEDANARCHYLYECGYQTWIDERNVL